jgi:hypothetical protein
MAAAVGGTTARFRAVDEIDVEIAFVLRAGRRVDLRQDQDALSFDLSDHVALPRWTAFA